MKASMIADGGCSVQSSWKTVQDFPSLSGVFAANGVELDGREFVRSLSGLCGSTAHVFGSWIDIVGVKGRCVAHSWHQDSGLDQSTVMVGFPAEDHYQGVGVFPHAVKLSHRLPSPDAPGPRVWDGSFDDKYVVRPLFGPGREVSEGYYFVRRMQPVLMCGGYTIPVCPQVMVYNDRDVFHSAPDVAHRESIWRFM
jgi:hypothetical protein